ncbi:MAG: RnfABCDGE type electron transport complex subunit G [Nitrospirae bacterium]|nr:RnfABCDGE type electron transport complex subunit G [Nitrospirota bacterium]
MTTKDMIKITINLAVIYIIGGLLLAGVYAKTSPVIYQKNEEEKQAALKEMMPDAGSILNAGEWQPLHKHANFYEAKSGDETTGYVAETFGKGYSSYIHVFVATDKNLVIKKIKILGHAETPGLGDEIEKDYFLKQFDGKDLDHLEVVKTETPDKIQAITGATISSRAVTNGVKDAVTMLKEKAEGNAPEEEKTHGKGVE